MQNGRLRGSFKAEHLNKCVMSHGPFGQQLQVLWLCDDHERIVDDWNAKNLTDLEAVQRGIETSRLWWRLTATNSAGLMLPTFPKVHH